MKKDETNSWGAGGWNHLSLVHVIAWMQSPAEESQDWLLEPGGYSKEGQLALFLVLFSYALLFGTFGLGLCGPSYPGLFWVRYGQCCWSIDTFELVIKGEREHPSVKYPVSPTWPSARRLWPLLRCWQSPRGRCRRGSYVPRVSTDGLEKL